MAIALTLRDFQMTPLAELTVLYKGVPHRIVGLSATTREGNTSLLLSLEPQGHTSKPVQLTLTPAELADFPVVISH